MNLQTGLQEIRKHGTDRSWWRKRFLTHIVARYYSVFGGTAGTPVIDLDWDNLLILDACRYDLFEKVFRISSLPGDLSKRTSVDSATPGFLRKTFGHKSFHDIVYVNANPYLDLLLDREQFHAVESVWQDAWNEEEQTVMPNAVAQKAAALAEEYPDKRLIVHFLQPHYPFVGEHRVGKRDVFAIREHALGNVDATQCEPTPFELLEQGKVSKDEVWRAYRSNLELVFPHVEFLLETLPGLTAVTADHGNALGERASPFPIRVYGHPLGILVPALTDVPWLTYQNGPRKKILSEPPVSEGQAVTDEVQNRLRSLGYAE